MTVRCVTRGVILLAALCTTLAVALPASAGDAQTLRGSVVSISTSAVAFKDAKGVVTTCAIADKSPSLDGYSAGDRVQAACVRTGRKLVLGRIRHLAIANGSVSNDTEPVKFSGAVTVLANGSITLHDGDRDLTCTINATSPSTADVKTGQHVRVSCVGGVLATLSPITVQAPGGDKPQGQTGAGVISVVSTTSVTVHNEEHGDLTCTVGPASPRLGDYKVGDKVTFGCVNSVLVAIAKVTSGTGDGTHHTVGAAGTVSAVSFHSLTVHTDGGEVTCTIGAGSPSVAELHVGDAVKIGCLDGILTVVTRAAPAPAGTGDAHTTTTAGGTLTVLSTSSITLHNEEHGDVSCTLGPASPHLGDFHVGDHVGMACIDGVLAKLVKL